MASSIPTTSVTKAAATTSSLCLHRRPLSQSNLSWCFSSRAKLRLSTTALRTSWNHSTVIRAQSNEVALDETLKNPATSLPELNSLTQEVKDSKPSMERSPAALATEESIAEFIAQVASLVKVVDSRDIVELQLKQLGCELLIRKKEALPQLPSPPPLVMMHSPPPPALEVAPPAAQPAVPSSATQPVISPPAAKAKSSLQPLKCPMAGTLYRSPAPGEPPFVKVGDKVQKGQVLCIIEAMKLMNEIEADQSGTIVEILVDDGKPVSVDMPLFVIEP